VRNVEFLGSTSQSLLKCLASLGVREGDELGVPDVIIAMRKHGISIRQTLAAIEECTVRDWLALRRLPEGQPDRLSFTHSAILAMRQKA
jgi:hypothetical protein